MMKLRSLAAVFFATMMLYSNENFVRGEALGKECENNDDCSDGATCVAGDSETSIQRCVAGTPCGGANAGGCPSDTVSGQLACIWRPDEKTCSGTNSGCIKMDGEWGIYKCISIDRCDQYFGGTTCSGSCSASNGEQCNGRGTCQLNSDSGGVPTFACECDSGWNGTKCDNVVDDSCVTDAGQCGDHGTCVDSACKCTDGYTGDQCEVAPSGSSSGSVSLSGSSSSSSSNSTDPGASNASSGKGSTQKGSAQSDESNTASAKKDGTNSAVFIIIGLLAAAILVAALLFALYSRKKKREQDLAGGAFGRSSSVDEGIEGAGGPPTPKGNIVTM